MKIDFKEAARIGSAYIKQWLPDGKQEGKEWVALNPKRADRKKHSFRVNLETFLWADFALMDVEGGDAVSLYAYLNDLSQLDAAKQILEKYGNMPAPAEKPKAATNTDWEPITPIPENIKAPDFKHYQHGKPSGTWCYRDAQSRVLFYITRYDKPDGGKEVIPWSYCKAPTGQTQWRMKSAKEPRPLYGLPELSTESGKPVLLVEGEKCKDAAASVLTKYVPVTWPGGARAVHKADFSSLHDREVIIWPDNDGPGKETASEIKKILTGKANVRIMVLPTGKEEGWDIADAILKEGWTEEDIETVIHARKQEKPRHPYPFWALGHDHGTYYFLSARTGDVITLNTGQLNKRGLMSLASLSFWEMEFASKNGPNWDVAVDTIMDLCAQAGPYDPAKLRGKGVWFDAGRVVYHLGDRLLCDGQVHPLNEFDTRFTYETRPAATTPIMAMADKTRGGKFLAICERLQFDRTIDSYLFAGWAFMAPVCGALEWRPHIYLTGPAGSGKSWVLNRILMPMLGQHTIFVLGKSTEAGVRQTLHNDALPVVIDEAESDDPNQKDTLQGLMTLMRQSSSDCGATIVRGTTTGKSLRFLIRSAFCFSSIGVSAHHHADESRLSILSLHKDERSNATQKFEELRRMVNETLNDEYCAEMRARAFHLVPVIRENARVFAKAAAERFGSQRAGDQTGALLAAAYAISHDDIVTYEQAVSFLSSEIFDERHFVSEQTDEDRCMQTILQGITRVEFGQGYKELSIGELVECAALLKSEPQLSPSDCDAQLRRIGIRVMLDGHDRHMFIANNHDGIKRILKNTPWENNYSRMLKRLRYASMGDHVRFAPGIKCRATKIAIDGFMDE